MKNYKNKIVASFDVDPQKGFTELCKELIIIGGHLIGDELLKNHKLSSFKVVSRDMHPRNPIWKAEVVEDMLKPVKGKNVDVKWLMHCEVGTVGAELLDCLPSPIDYDYCVSKGLDSDVHPYGACYHDLADTKTTGVIEFLKSKGVEVVLVGGLATDHCVYKTVMQLSAAGFEVILNLAACRGVDSTTTDAAIADMASVATICENAEQVAEVLLA
ncbi:Nicotinamidase [Vibrio chagasii]|nr:Nicotinamidase [Vibrio chagasii]